MASSSRPSGASVPGGLDVAWKYARPIEGIKHGTICTFCESTFQSGGITWLKYHLAGFDPHKSVKKCKEVLLDIKKEVIAWIKDKESRKQHKKSVEENIRSTSKGGIWAIKVAILLIMMMMRMMMDMHIIQTCTLRRKKITLLPLERQGKKNGLDKEKFTEWEANDLQEEQVVVVNCNNVALKAFETHSDLLL
ncbi:hypothetical protein ACFX1Z_001066 [Malus domestica]